MNAPVRILNVGISQTGVCGVRDYGRVLAAALSDLELMVETSWHDTEPSWTPRVLRRETRKWLLGIDEAIDRTAPDWILWHYSVFAYAYRGAPILARLTARRLAATGVPVVGLLHELVYPFGRRGIRGSLHATSQRAVLPAVIRHCAALVVTVPERAAWLEAAGWLPHRPTLFLPVCSNLPDAPEATALPTEGILSIGVFSFGSEGYFAAPVVGAVRRLRQDGASARLLLIGAPGPGTPPAERWLDAAEREGCRDAIAFTGVLEPAPLARQLRHVDVVVLPDPAGPSAKKGTLAAALSVGTPVIAFDGPARWDALVEEHAVQVSPPAADALATRLGELLTDPAAKHAQGQRGQAFYRRVQAPGVIAGRLSAFLESVAVRPLTRAHNPPPVEA